MNPQVRKTLKIWKSIGQMTNKKGSFKAGTLLGWMNLLLVNGWEVDWRLKG
jgi:hypothetical protein